MLYLLVKAAVSGVLIALISEVARKNPGWGGLLASLPLVSLMAMVWLWRDTHDPQRVGDQAISTFWFVLPSLPLFLILPLLIRAGWGFWIAILVSCLVTLILYAAMFAVSARLGMRL
jgi:cobalamin synthase